MIIIVRFKKGNGTCVQLIVYFANVANFFFFAAWSHNIHFRNTSKKYTKM